MRSMPFDLDIVIRNTIGMAVSFKLIIQIPLPALNDFVRSILIVMKILNDGQSKVLWFRFSILIVFRYNPLPHDSSTI